MAGVLFATVGTALLAVACDFLSGNALPDMSDVQDENGRIPGDW
jgi:hypothetical protein